MPLSAWMSVCSGPRDELASRVMRLCDRSVWRRGRHQGGGPLGIYAEMISENFRKLAGLSVPAVAMVTDDGDAACRSVIKGVSADNPAREIFTLGRSRIADQHVENVCVVIVIGGHPRRGG